MNGVRSPGSADRRQMVRKVLKGAGFRTGSVITSRLLTVVRIIVFARLFTPDTVGTAAIALAAVTFAFAFADFGFLENVIRRHPLRRDNANTAFTMSLLAGAVVFAVVFVSAPLVSELLSQDVTTYIRFLAIFVLTIPLTFPLVYWESALDFEHPAAALVIREFIALAAAIAVQLIFSLGVWSILIGYVGGLGAQAAYIWLLASQRPSLAVHAKYRREGLSFGVPYMFQSVNRQVASRADFLMVGAFNGPTQVGYYSVAWNVPLMLGSLATAIDTMLLPVFARFDSSRQELASLFNRANKMWSVIGSFCCFPLIVFPAEIVEIVFGSTWEPAAPLLRVMSIAFLIRFCTGYAYDNLVLVRGRTKYMMKWGFVNTLLVFSLGLFMIREYGPIGGAWFWVIQASVLGPLVRLPLIWDELRTLQFVRHVWQPVAAGLIAVAGASGAVSLLGDGAAGMAAAAVVYVSLYASILPVVDRSLTADLKRMIALARSKEPA